MTALPIRGSCAAMEVSIILLRPGDPALQGEGGMAVSFLALPMRGAVFGRNGQTSLVSQVMFPSTKLAVGTFPRVALAATPCACLTTQVLERRAEMPPPRGCFYPPPEP